MNRAKINRKYYEKNTDMILLNKRIKYLDDVLNKKYYCEACDYAAGIERDLTKHLKTKKHAKNNQ